MTTRKKNVKEKEKTEKQKLREQKKLDRERRKQERIVKKKLREEKKAQKQIKSKLCEGLNNSCVNELNQKIEPKFFFCPEVQQYANNLSCIFRIFNKDHAATIGGSCEKCKKMNEYIPIIEEIINGKQTVEGKKSGRHKTIKVGSKIKEKTTGTRKAKARGE